MMILPTLHGDVHHTPMVDGIDASSIFDLAMGTLANDEPSPEIITGMLGLAPLDGSPSEVLSFLCHMPTPDENGELEPGWLADVALGLVGNAAVTSLSAVYTFPPLSLGPISLTVVQGVMLQANGHSLYASVVGGSETPFPVSAAMIEDLQAGGPKIWGPAWTPGCDGSCGGHE